MNNNNIPYYFKTTLLPSFPKDCSPENPCIVIMDGVGPHKNFTFLKECKDKGIHVVLRPPHTTSKTQPEDTTNFRVFKIAYDKEKLKFKSSKRRFQSTDLEGEDIMKCVKPAWEAAFSIENNLKGWATTGVVPFTRCVYYELLDEELRADASLSHSNLIRSPSSSFPILRDEATEAEEEGEEFSTVEVVESSISSRAKRTERKKVPKKTP